MRPDQRGSTRQAQQKPVYGAVLCCDVTTGVAMPRGPSLRFAAKVEQLHSALLVLVGQAHGAARHHGSSTAARDLVPERNESRPATTTRALRLGGEASRQPPATYCLLRSVRRAGESCVSAPAPRRGREDRRRRRRRRRVAVTCAFAGGPLRARVAPPPAFRSV